MEIWMSNNFLEGENAVKTKLIIKHHDKETRSFWIMQMKDFARFKSRRRKRLAEHYSSYNAEFISKRILTFSGFIATGVLNIEAWEIVAEITTSDVF